MSGNSYFPPPGQDWARVAPREAGFDPVALQQSIDFSIAHETDWPTDINQQLGRGHFEPPPWNEIIGPVRDRGGVNGLVLRGGRIVAEWGDTARADMTFSVSKSYVSTCAGLAFDDGLIADVREPVRERVRDGGFDSPHNAAISWEHLLHQTSEWEGELWSKPDLIDRNRDLSLEGAGKNKGQHRDLQVPGTYWEYNDVRVNRLSLAVMRVLRRPLPEVLKARIMDPIGASDTWEWHGYRNSYVTIDGREMQSVSGGGHWGGGIFIGSRDHARFGHLFLNRGQWGERRLLSDDWIARATAPCPIKPDYGYLWWLNLPGGGRFGAGSSRSFFASGAGSSIVWVCPEQDMVAVVRWIAKDAVNEWVRLLLRAAG